MTFSQEKDVMIHSVHLEAETETFSVPGKKINRTDLHIRQYSFTETTTVPHGQSKLLLMAAISD